MALLRPLLPDDVEGCTASDKGRLRDRLLAWTSKTRLPSWVGCNNASAAAEGSADCYAPIDAPVKDTKKKRRSVCKPLPASLLLCLDKLLLLVYLLLLGVMLFMWAQPRLQPAGSAPAAELGPRSKCLAIGSFANLCIPGWAVRWLLTMGLLSLGCLTVWCIMASRVAQQSAQIANKRRAKVATADIEAGNTKAALAVCCKCAALGDDDDDEEDDDEEDPLLDAVLGTLLLVATSLLCMIAIMSRQGFLP